MDACLEIYNRPQRHCGRGMKARTPYDIFKVGIPEKSPPRKKPARNEIKTIA